MLKLILVSNETNLNFILKIPIQLNCFSKLYSLKNDCVLLVVN